jgi:dimethylsulfoniopropionate demethylase
MLKLGEDKFWLSVADSDVLLYAKGIALGSKMDVTVSEPDVSPLAIQGPKAEKLIAKIFGDHIKHINFFKFGWIEFKGTQQLIARSGYSRQGGFEIYLQNNKLGSDLWNTIWEAGIEFKISPGCPNLIERIEGGLLSYGNEFTRENNPLEIGLGKFCSLDGSIDYIGRGALEKIASNGATKKIRGIIFEGDKCPTCSLPWSVMVGNEQIGQITSAIWSPRLKKNVGLSLIDRKYWSPQQPVEVHCQDNKIRSGEISRLPFS